MGTGMQSEGMWEWKGWQNGENVEGEGDSRSSPLPGDGVTYSLSWPGPHCLPEIGLNL